MHTHQCAVAPALGRSEGPGPTINSARRTVGKASRLQRLIVLYEKAVSKGAYRRADRLQAAIQHALFES